MDSMRWTSGLEAGRPLGDLSVNTRHRNAIGKSDADPSNPASYAELRPTVGAPSLGIRLGAGSDMAGGVSSTAAPLGHGLPLPGTLQSFDAQNRKNALYTTDYVQQIFQHLRQAEESYKVRPDYMLTRQTQVTEKMRMILVDWLVDVHLKYKCRPETFFLTVNLIDRYLEKKSVMKNKLQLLGCACMMIAAKYEEMFPPEVHDYIHISANTYTREEMLQMERSVLTVLEFSLTVPTLYPFVKRWLQAFQDDDCYLQHGALYLAEHCTVKYEMLQWEPSKQAAACVLLAARVLRKPNEWPSSVTQCSGYSPSDISTCVQTLEEWMMRVPTHKFQAIRKKFSHAKYSEVAKKFDRWAGRTEHVETARRTTAAQQ